MKTYLRKNTYEAFLNHNIPVINTTCELDITLLYTFRKKTNYNFSHYYAI